nr:MAG: replication associated protein [Cressdnaviricota sp.]
MSALSDRAMSKRSRNYVFTRNNFVDTVQEDTLDCRFISYAKEIAPSTGTPHLQGYVCFTDAKTHSSVKKLLKGSWCEPMKGSIQENDIYASKFDIPTERGDKPLSNDDKGRANQLRWHRTRQLAKEGRLDDIDADLYIKHYSTLKRIQSDNQPKIEPTDVKCYWICGPPGTGKSHEVYYTFPDAYKKNMDKPDWFDHYNMEDVVYLEDIDKYQVKWAGLLKRLSDKWPMQAQIKGDMKMIRPKTIIVTSNYTIDGIWDDAVTREALGRRFKLIEKYIKGPIDW